MKREEKLSNYKMQGKYKFAERWRRVLNRKKQKKCKALKIYGINKEISYSRLQVMNRK